MKRSHLATLVALGAAALLVLACRASVKMQTGPGVPIFGGSSLDVDIDGRTVTVPPGGSQGPKAGDCVKLTFYDAAGNPLGSSEVKVGGPGADAPPGTEDLTVSPCDPKDPDDTKANTFAGGASSFVAQPVLTFAYRSVPLDAVAHHGRFVDFTVRASTRDEADAIAADFERYGTSRPCPQELTPYDWVDVSVGADGRVLVYLFATSRPTAAAFAWNGQRLGTLQDAQVVTARGWWSAVLSVPRGLVNWPSIGQPASNVLAFELATAFRSVSSTVTLQVSP